MGRCSEQMPSVGGGRRIKASENLKNALFSSSSGKAGSPFTGKARDDVETRYRAVAATSGSPVAAASDNESKAACWIKPKRESFQTIGLVSLHNIESAASRTESGRTKRRCRGGGTARGGVGSAIGKALDGGRSERPGGRQGVTSSGWRASGTACKGGH